MSQRDGTSRIFAAMLRTMKDSMILQPDRDVD
jgi:hypothetical protein